MKLLGINYTNVTLTDALAIALTSLTNNKKSNIYFLNSDCLLKTQHDQEYCNIINPTNLILPDGVGIRFATWLFGGKMKGNCNGTDFSPLLMKKAAEKGYKIFFLGAKEGIAQKAAENVKKSIPGIHIVGTHSGYLNNDEEAVKMINDSQADILFVAMGVPIQEKWIARNRDKLSPRLCLGVGALFDYLSGNSPRAPKIIRILYLEWLWRVIVEPKRLFKRYLVDGVGFFCWLVGYRIKQLITGEKTS